MKNFKYFNVVFSPWKQGRSQHWPRPRVGPAHFGAKSYCRWHFLRWHFHFYLAFFRWASGHSPGGLAPPLLGSKRMGQMQYPRTTPIHPKFVDGPSTREPSLYERQWSTPPILISRCLHGPKDSNRLRPWSPSPTPSTPLSTIDSTHSLLTTFPFPSSATSPLHLSHPLRRAQADSSLVPTVLRHQCLILPPVFLISGSAGDVLELCRVLLALYHPKNLYILHLDARPPCLRVSVDDQVCIDLVCEDC